MGDAIDDEDGFSSLFDGTTLDGWTAIPRVYGSAYPGEPALDRAMPPLPPDHLDQARRHPAVWSVEDGAIVGRQAPDVAGFGGYLLSDRAVADLPKIGNA